MSVPRRRAESKACSTRRFWARRHVFQRLWKRSADQVRGATRPGDVPNHIRENLPEELRDLPADLIYATDLNVLEFSRSEAVEQAADAHDSLVEQIEVLHGDGSIIPWPRWAQDAAMSTYDDYVRVRRRQEDAMRWVQENRHPAPVTSSSSSDGRMAVDESGEEAGEEDPQNDPVP